MPEINPVSGQFYSSGVDDIVDPQKARSPQDTLNLVIEDDKSKGGRTLTGSSGEPPSIPLPNVKASDADNFIYMFMALQSKSMDVQLSVSKTDIGVRMEKQKAVNEDRITKLKEAADAAEKSKVGGIFGKVFAWIGAALAVVAAVAATIATGGAAWPLIAAAVIGVTMLALNETGAMEKIVAGFASIMSPPMDEDKAKMVANIIIGVAVTAIMIGLTVASGGAAAGNLVSATMQNVANMIKIGAQVGTGIAQIGQGASQITTSVYAKDAAFSRADAMQFNKQIMQLQAMIDDEMKRIEEILKKMDEGVATMMQIFSDQAKTKDFINQQSAA